MIFYIDQPKMPFIILLKSKYPPNLPDLVLSDTCKTFSSRSLKQTSTHLQMKLKPSPNSDRPVATIKKVIKFRGIITKKASSLRNEVHCTGFGFFFFSFLWTLARPQKRCLGFVGQRPQLIFNH